MALPAHASPVISPEADANHTSIDSPVSLGHVTSYGETHNKPSHDWLKSPPPILTPSITPPPGEWPHSNKDYSTSQDISTNRGTDLDTSIEQPTAPALIPVLPKVTCEVRARIPTTVGQEMFLHLYHNDIDNKEHLAIVFGPNIRSKSLDASRPGETEKDRMIRGAYTGRLYPGRTDSRSSSSTPKSPQVTESASSVAQAPLVRIHSECYTGETVWSARCDCGEQLDEAARLMSMSSSDASGDNEHSAGGVIIYLRQEGRGIGLLSKLKAYNLQDLGHDTMQANLLLRHPADARSYGLATAMLLDLGLGSTEEGKGGIRLLTNNPEKIRAVEGPHREVRVVQRVPMIPLAWRSNGQQGIQGPEIERYISTKIEKFKHMFTS